MSLRWYAFLCGFDSDVFFYNRPLKKHIILFSKCTSRLADKRIHIKLVSSQVYDDDDLHEGQRSSEVKSDKLCSMATKFGQKNPWWKFMMMMTCMEVKGHQRSNVINYVLWLPNLVRKIPDASLWWWWPSWRSKVIRGQR